MMRTQPFLGALVLAASTGCVTQKPVMISPTTLGPGQEEVVGVVTGRARADYAPIMLGYSALGNAAAPMNAAVRQALSGTKAHALVNVIADRRCVFVPFPVLYFFARCELTVTGTAVRYKNLKTADFMNKISQNPRARPPETRPAAPRRINNPAGTEEETLYEALLESYRESPRNASRHYGRLSPNEKVSIMEHAARSKGRVSGGSGRLLVRRGLPSIEKRFVLWLLSGRSKYRPVIR